MTKLVLSDIQVVSPIRLEKNNFFSCFKTNESGFVYADICESDQLELVEIMALESRYKRLDRTVLLALLAASRLHVEKGANTSVFISSSRGATSSWEHNIDVFLKTHKVGVSTSPITTLANISSEVSSYLNLKGIALEHSLTCSSGIASVLHAAAWIRSGMGTKVVVGASEAANTPFTMAQISALGINSPYSSNNTPCRPFNKKNENTFVLSEACGLAHLEEKEEHDLLESDLVIEGLGYSFVNPPSLTGIDAYGTALQESMRMALKEVAGSVDLILAHAPGTVKGDLAEFNAIRMVFAEKLPYIFSSKMVSGHSYAASAFINLSVAQLLFRGYRLPLMDYENYLGDQIFPSKINRILINATGFGGNAMSLVVSVKK